MQILDVVLVFLAPQLIRKEPAEVSRSFFR